MKRRFASIAGTLCCVTLVVVACGGSDFEGPSGNDAGTTSAGSPSPGAGGEPSAGADPGGSSAGKTSGGTASGGTASGGTASGGKAGSGGTASGGTASGGTASGGTASGGTASGGKAGSGGTASGGTASGGTAGSGGGGMDPLTCETDNDCTDCAYPTAPQTAADCYCATCANTPLSKAACATNHAAWTKNCSGTTRICPAIACIVPPVPKCKSKMCAAG